MAEITRRTIVAAIVTVGESERPLLTPDGQPVLSAGGLTMQTVKTLVIADIDSATETTVLLEPGSERDLASALTGGVVLATAADMPGGNGS